MKPLSVKPGRQRPDKRPDKRPAQKTEAVSQVDFSVSITPSLQYATFLVCLHAFSLIALWQTPYLPGPLLTALVMLVIGSATLTAYRSAEYTTLSWMTDEHLLLSVEHRNVHQLSPRQQCRGTLSARSLHCSVFVLLEMRDHNGHYRHCLIPRDAVSIAGFRKLRAQLYLLERVTD